MIREITSFDWNAPVSPEEREQILRKIAAQVTKRGLQTPALWMLEIHKPLMPLGSQFAVAFSPLLGALMAGGARDLQKITKLMQEPGNVDRLIELIENEPGEAG
jgi:acyl-CoA reductase-like NAD-dependent aldehyde dehydrogenase